MNFYRFRADYRKNVNNVMSEMGLRLVSSPRQIENGTLLYRDLETGCLYGLYESGYCRRFVESQSGCGQTIKGRNYKMYQLNRRVKLNQRKPKKTPFAKTYPPRYMRIMANPIEQLGIVVSAITRYRINYQYS
jgi:hypothetical protein